MDEKNKTEVFLLNYGNSDNGINLHFDNTILEISKSHKHLGVTLSLGFKWSEHINLCQNMFLCYVN